MGVNLKTETETFVSGKKDWVASRMGFDVCRSVTIDVSLFNALHYANGYIPSGTVLGKVTATGLYGPYSPLLANGLDVNAGHLLEDVVVGSGDTTAKVGVALFWHGIVLEANLPTFTGAASALGVLDANGRTDMAAHIRYEAL